MICKILQSFEYFNLNIRFKQEVSVLWDKINDIESRMNIWKELKNNE